MEQICEYCKQPFTPKRADALYCSHSCRQLAYVLRKAAGGNGIDGLKELTYKPDPSKLVQYNKEPSTKTELVNDYPSTLSERLDKQLRELTDNTDEPSIKHMTKNNYLSTKFTAKENIETETVNTDKKATVNPSINKQTKEEYTEYGSEFINELAKLTIEREYESKLGLMLYNNRESSAFWVSVRYKCLLECLLTFSEMKSIDLDDLKEVCNALIMLTKSRSFGYLTYKYPYTEEIIQLKDAIRSICIDNEDNEEINFRFKKETKIKMIASRWELSQSIPKVSFSELNFKE